MERIKQLFTAAGAFALVETVLRAFNDLFSRQCLSSAGLAVGTTTTKFKLGNAIYVAINGVTQLVASADGPVLTGYNLTSAQVGGFVVTVDTGGVINALPIQPAAALNGIGYPVVPPTQAVVGLVLINTTNAATFTGGTTLMNASNVAYVNIVGPFNPTNAF